MTAPPPVPFFDLGRQYREIGPALEEAVLAVLRSGQYVLGAEGEAFERELAAIAGTPHAVGVASGTDALILALRAAGVGPGDEVLVPAFTFYATAAAVSLIGARPVFVDVDSQSFLIDPDDLARRRTPRARAVVPVHLFGQCAPMERIARAAAGLAVIEDAAQALGATRGGRGAGGLGDFGAVSFYPTKNLGGVGDGGAVLCPDAAGAQRLRLLRNLGQKERYRHDVLGTNSRLDELQAAALRVKARHLGRWNDARRARARRYEEALAAVPGLRTPGTLPDNVHTWHQYVIRVDRRDACKAALAARGVGTAVYYATTIPKNPCFADLDQGPYPGADEAARTVLALPIFPELTFEEQDRVVAALRAGW
jgi:dTDP-4-amino-4,6-dideoxygalactose transaminase